MSETDLVSTGRRSLSSRKVMGKGWLLSAALGMLKLGAGAAKAAGDAVALQRALGAMSGQRLSFLQTLTTGIGGLLRAIPGLGFVTSAFGAAAAIISGPVIAAVAGLAAGGFAVWKYWDGITTVVSAAAGALGDRLAPALGFARPALEAIQPVLSALGEAFAWVADKAGAVGDWLGGFFQQSKMDGAEKAKLAASTKDMVNGAIDTVVGAGSAMADAGKSLMASLLDGIKAGATAIFNFASNIGSRVASSITGAASRAWNAVTGGQPAPASPAPARARGGGVTRGRSYLVGERRPEVFTPGQSGYISPRASGGDRSSLPPIKIDLHVNGVSDPKAAAEHAYALLERRLRDLFRGVQGDVGFDYS